MGLDMFLSKEEYISGMSFDKKAKEYKNRKIEVKIVEPDGSEEVKVYVGKNITIQSNEAYWRKFNALHNWFVDECGDGEDNCKPIYVAHEKLKEIHGILKRLKDELVLVEGKITNGYTYNEKGEKIYEYVDGKYIKNKELAQELLPTEDGFFFGSTDYDEWYYKDVVDAEKEIGNLIKDKDFEKYDYYYEASW